MPSWEIYKITHKSNEKSYIGLTKTGVNNRWYQHVWDANNRRSKADSSPFYRAIRKYGPSAFAVEVLIVAPSYGDAMSAEKQMIALYDTLSPNGYNLTPGGEVGPITAEHRAKIGAAHRGRKQLRAIVERRAAAIRGRKRPPDVVARVAAARKNRAHTPDTRAKMSATRKGRKPSDSARAAMSAARKGKKASQEAIENMRKAAAKRSADPAYREKLRVATTGRKHSDETLAKLRAAWKRRKLRLLKILVEHQAPPRPAGACA